MARAGHTAIRLVLNPAERSISAVTDDPLVHLASLPSIDTSIANVARAWNYMVGGKDNYEVDREAVRQLTKVAPVIPVAARSSRDFLGRVVRYLAGEAEIRQFLDV